MSKVNKVDKVDTEILTSVESPQVMSFEDMKRSVAEYKRLEKIIKALPKEERAKLLPKRVREVSKRLIPMIDEIALALVRNETEIVEEFKTTISAEKPNGQRWITFRLPNYTFCLAINKPKDK